MLTRAQQILLKRAQAQARIGDADYRCAIGDVTSLPGATSSKDPRLGDAHLDNLLAYFEAIYWRAVDAGEWVHQGGGPVFRERGFWACRNRRGNTSRDRYTRRSAADQIGLVEFDLMQLGYDETYLAAIRRNITPCTDWKYLAALRRTLESKTRNASAGPF